ncbi:MAG: response regulator transcription factor [Paenibacillaceae bacterium]|nr:response regulator transcription factor [Paenibacillaceae bacterium]
MIRILLVEDEPLFRKGLAKMIAGSGMGWTVCGEAENGQEAERIIAELLPDLVLTDIRMPLMDGLELLQRTKASYPAIEFIVITGYQDFQYAQTALRSGALDLLVKPCSKQDIHDALGKANAQLASSQLKRRKEASEHQLLLENTLRASFLRFPTRKETVAELERVLAERQLVLFHIADFLPAHKQYVKRDVPLLQFAVLNIISELLDVHGLAGTLLLIESGRFALFMPGQVEALALCEAVQDTVHRLLGLAIVSHQAGAVGDLSRLADTYEAVMAAGGPQRAQQQEEPSGEPAGGAAPINRAKQQLLAAQTLSFILAGQTEALGQYLEQQMKDIRAMREDAWRIEALSFSFALQETARKQLEQEYDSPALPARIGKLHNCRSGDEVYAWLQEETARFMGALGSWQHKYNAGTVTRAIRYMEEHYAEPLSLQQVASHIHLNATYFSHLFKKETGRSFVTYLVDLRMEKAKKLLSNTDLNVTEVSGLIGYDLPNYFAKLFKQSTGLSPKEYRKQHQP